MVGLLVVVMVVVVCGVLMGPPGVSLGLLGPSGASWASYPIGTDLRISNFGPWVENILKLVLMVGPGRAREKMKVRDAQEEKGRGGRPWVKNILKLGHSARTSKLPPP